MAIEQGIYTLLTEDATLTALTSNVFWVMAPKAATFPLVILGWVSTDDTVVFNGDLGFRNGLLQVDCYSSQYYNSRLVATAVRDLLKSYSGTLPDVNSTVVAGVVQTKDWDMPYEEGAVGFVFRSMLEFRIWYRD